MHPGEFALDLSSCADKSSGPTETPKKERLKQTFGSVEILVQRFPKCLSSLPDGAAVKNGVGGGGGHLFLGRPAR